MVQELKNSIDAEKVFFGIKQCLKNQKNLQEAVLVSDHRKDIRKILEVNNVNTRTLDLSKDEVTERLGLRFKCEVFGVRK